MTNTIDPKRFHPRGEAVLVRRIPAEEKTKTGIILAEKHRLGAPKKVQYAEVISKGDKVPDEVMIGAKVMLHGYAENTAMASWTFDGQEYAVISGKAETGDVLAVIGA